MCVIVVLCMGCLSLRGLCCVEIIFVWELCNVEKLHRMWNCMSTNFVLWDNCARFGRCVIREIALVVRFILCMSYVT